MFPVGLLSLLFAAIANSNSAKTVSLPVPDFSDIDTKRDLSVAVADARRNKKLEELKEANRDRLNKASKEQKKELEELSNKPISEVVKWFDKL